MQVDFSPTCTWSRGQCVPQSRLPGAPRLALSPHPPTLGSPKVQASHHSTWPPLRLFICVSCSDRTKTSGRDEEKQDRMWKEARGEEEELRPQHHVC